MHRRFAGPNEQRAPMALASLADQLMSQLGHAATQPVRDAVVRLCGLDGACILDAVERRGTIAVRVSDRMAKASLFHVRAQIERHFRKKLTVTHGA